MTAERCGSYPLMNLAADYGVDYGDLLIAVWHQGYLYRGERAPPQLRDADGMEAISRISRAIIDDSSYYELGTKVAEHLRRRWG